MRQIAPFLKNNRGGGGGGEGERKEEWDPIPIQNGLV